MTIWGVEVVMKWNFDLRRRVGQMLIPLNDIDGISIEAMTASQFDQRIPYHHLISI